MTTHTKIPAHVLKVFLFVLCASSPASAEPPRYPNHSDLSYYLAPDGSRVPIKTGADWAHRREHILEGMQAAMGPLPHPKSPVPLDVQILEEHQEDGYVRRKIAYHTDDSKSRTHAWLLLPVAGLSEAGHKHPA